MSKLYLLIISICLFIILPNYSSAETYIIKKGDTPAKIAKKYNVNVKKLIEINKLNPKKLELGRKITIPSTTKSTDKKTSDKIKIAKKHQNTNKRDIIKEESKKFYIVKKGDTLYSISKKYSIPVEELKDLNNLDTNKLHKGQKLLLKKVPSDFYIVKKGDTIYRISKRFNISIEDLKNINNLSTNTLKPGQKLLLEQKIVKNYDAVIKTKTELEEEPILEIEPEDQNLSTKEKLILLSKKLLNIPYRFGGNSIFGLDCSAFVQKVYKLIGIELPRSAREQYVEGIPVEKDELSVGDLVFFKTYASFPSHVGIYLGNNLFIHASSRSKKVTIDSLDTPYYFRRYIGAKRILELDNNIGHEG
jgi:cell wall-associated NlpC family hydrolase/competence protein ComGC